MVKLFYKYVSRSVIGLIGISIYAVVDTFFVAKCNGADGITALNLIMPLYMIIYAIGSMIGVGAAVYYAINKASGSKNIDICFSNAIIWQTIASIPFVIFGIFFADKWVYIMGGDENIIKLGTNYARVIFLGTPFAMFNYTFTSFVRNDKAPTLVMCADVCSSVFNIVFDYIFMFPLKMGFFGAGLATALAPIVSCGICMIHIVSKKSNIKWKYEGLNLNFILKCLRMGLSSFINQISQSIIIVVYNFLLLKYLGNIGVAAYGIVVNYTVFPVTVFDGIIQGAQPLISNNFGKGNMVNVKKLLKLAVLTSLILGLVFYLICFIYTTPLIQFYNGDNNLELAKYAKNALILYFIGFIYGGVNTAFVGYFASIGQSIIATVLSILRGVVLIVFIVIIMAMLFGINGIWLAYAVTELIMLVVIVYIYYSKRNNLLVN